MSDGRIYAVEHDKTSAETLCHRTDDREWYRVYGHTMTLDEANIFSASENGHGFVTRVVQIPGLAAAGPWIATDYDSPLNNKYPPNHLPVLVFDSLQGRSRIAARHDGEWVNRRGKPLQTFEVTHWATIVEPEPEE